MIKKKYIRVLIVEGEADWVEATLEKSFLQPNKPFDLGKSKITEILRKELTDEDIEDRFQREELNDRQ